MYCNILYIIYYFVIIIIFKKVGTIPIEASCLCPTAMYYGGDIDQDEIYECALENIKYMTKLTGKRPPIDIFVWNCKKIPLGESSVDRIVTGNLFFAFYNR